MPVEPVIIDTSIIAVGAAAPSYGNVLLVGEDEAGGLGVNVVKEYTTIVDVGTDFGTASKVYKAAEMAFNQGVAKLWAVKVDVTSIAVEAIARGAAASFAKSPVKGGTVVIAGVVVSYAYNNPPVDPGALKAEVGSESTKIFINGAGPVNVAYDYYDLTALEAVIKNYEEDIDILYFCGFTQGAGNGGAGPQDWGILTEIVDLCDAYTWMTVIPGRGGETEVVQKADLVLASYVSMNVMLVAHKDSSTDDDVGAAVVGRMSVVEPWDKMMWKPIKGLDDANVAMFSKTEIADLETAKINALFFRSGEYRPSDGLTSVGGSDYKYVDITRTRYYLERTIKSDLGDLIQNTSIPYSPAGIAIVQSQIQHTCEDAVLQGALRVPWTDSGGDFHRGYVVEVPDFADVSDADRLGRILRNVFVTVYLRGHIQEIRLNLAIVI